MVNNPFSGKNIYTKLLMFQIISYDEEILYIQVVVINEIYNFIVDWQLSHLRLYI
jgi:hypothetical protein